jgi:hypothetical protein
MFLYIYSSNLVESDTNNEEMAKAAAVGSQVLFLGEEVEEDG